MTATGTNENDEVPICDNKETVENATLPLSTQTTSTGNAEPFDINLNSQQKEKLKEVFEYLAENPRIIFKSQQIDDPEIEAEEKIEIAKNMLITCHLKFLQKFGAYLTKDHLMYLKELDLFHTDDYESSYLFKNLLSNLEHRQSYVKNRRFTAMKRMMLEQNEYFSETEMMKREPLLYEQLVGQYLTESEKNIRDGYNPKATLFSQILLDNYDRDQRNKLRKQQLLEAKMEDEDDDDEESTQKSFTSSKITHNGLAYKNEEEMFPKVPPSYRKKWGNFEDDDDAESNENSKPGTSSGRLLGISQMERNQQLDFKQKYVTAGEREMLRQEFLGIMRSKFIDGIDKDFDYSNIDDNTELDDLDQINQDCEDKYFEDDDVDNECITQNEISESFENQNTVDDDLDIYMKNLTKIV